MSLERPEAELVASREKDVEPVRLPTDDDAVFDTSALPLPLCVSETVELAVTDNDVIDDNSADGVIFPEGERADDDERVGVVGAELAVATVPEAPTEKDTVLDTVAVEALLGESIDDAVRDEHIEAENKGEVEDATDVEGFTVSVAAGDELNDDRLLGDEITERVSADADDEGVTLASEVSDRDCLPVNDEDAEAITDELEAGDNEVCTDDDPKTDALFTLEVFAEIENAFEDDGI